MKFTHQSEFILTFDKQFLYTETIAPQTHLVPLTIVFVHGLGGDLMAWQPVISILSDLFPAVYVSYDLRGHGQSTRCFPPNTENIYQVGIQDLEKIYQTYADKNTKVVLIGHSWGGMLVQEFMNHFQPKNVVGCIFISTYPRLFFPFLARFQNFFYTVLTHVNPQNQTKHLKFRTVQDHYCHQNHFDYSFTRIYSDIRAMGLNMYLFSWLAASGWKNKYWKDFDVQENLYIYGTRDLLIPNFSQQKVTRDLKAMPVITWPSNHNPLINNTTELAKILKGQLEKYL